MRCKIVIMMMLYILVSSAIYAQDLTKSYSSSKFSLKYPSSWQIVQDDECATANTVISLQIMAKQINDFDFRPNINIIVSRYKRTESTNQLALGSYKSMVNAGINIRLVKQPSPITISGLSGSVIEYVMYIEGYPIRGIQYILKKADNTTYIITSSLDNDKLSIQRRISDNIINSIRIK